MEVSVLIHDGQRNLDCALYSVQIQRSCFSKIAMNNLILFSIMFIIKSDKNNDSVLKYHESQVGVSTEEHEYLYCWIGSQAK